jgi:hypothetical protein
MTWRFRFTISGLLRNTVAGCPKRGEAPKNRRAEAYLAGTLERVD